MAEPLKGSTLLFLGGFGDVCCSQKLSLLELDYLCRSRKLLGIDKQIWFP